MSQDMSDQHNSNESTNPPSLFLAAGLPPPKLPPLIQHQMNTNSSAESTDSFLNESSIHHLNKRSATQVSNIKNRSPKKRMTSIQSDNNSLPSQVAYTSRPYNSTNINNTISPINRPFQHHIKQTFLGPVCTKCNIKVARNNTLFDISEYLIKVHLTTNQCFYGDCSFHQVKELRNFLQTSITQTHCSMKNNPSLAAIIVRDNFHERESIRKFPYCSRCGYVGTQIFNVARHIKSMSNSCSEYDIRTAGHIIKVNKYGFLVPSELLDQIAMGKFSLPDRRVQPGSTSKEAHASTGTQNRNYPTTTSTQVYPVRFLPTENDIMASNYIVHHSNDALSMASFAQSELLDTFGTKEHANTAHEYLTCFIHLINQQSPGSLRRTLMNYTSIMKLKPTDFNHELLLLSGKMWLQSNSANMDVRMVHVHHRNSMYLIGNTLPDSDKDLLKGSTFVWSENIEVIVSQFTSLITFAHNTKWPILTPFISQVDQIYMTTRDMDPSRDKQQVLDLAASKIVNTNIIFGLLTEILLEQPCLPNGPNLIYKFLAGSTVRLNHNQTITLRNHNEISKRANALLRLLRHGICSMYVRKSRDMTQQHHCHEEFNRWANEVIQEMQVCQSIGHICRTIRTAREVDRKTPSLVHKAFNDKTGELVVSGNHIHRSIWSVAIPTAVAEWDTYLTSLFPNHSPSSNLPLHWIFDLNNSLVLAGSDSYISVGESPDESIPLSEFCPVLPMYVKFFTTFYFLHMYIITHYSRTFFFLIM